MENNLPGSAMCLMTAFIFMEHKEVSIYPPGSFEWM